MTQQEEQEVEQLRKDLANAIIQKIIAEQRVKKHQEVMGVIVKLIETFQN